MKTKVREGKWLTTFETREDGYVDVLQENKSLNEFRDTLFSPREVKKLIELVEKTKTKK